MITLEHSKTELAIEKLRNEGCRITSQRKILIDIILGHECASCKEIHFLATKKDAGIGIATVYRMVRLLEDFDLIQRAPMYQIKHE